MRGKSQLLRGVSLLMWGCLVCEGASYSSADERCCAGEYCRRRAPRDWGISYFARNAGEALKIVCGTGRDLDLALIDFEHGPHGINLLKAIDACRKDFPVIVIMEEDQEHVELLARANGAVESFSKLVAPAETEKLFALVDASGKTIGRFQVDFHRWQPRHAQILVFSFTPRPHT